MAMEVSHATSTGEQLATRMDKGVSDLVRLNQLVAEQYREECGEFIIQSLEAHNEKAKAFWYKLKEIMERRTNRKAEKDSGQQTEPFLADMEETMFKLKESEDKGKEKLKQSKDKGKDKLK
ncbi:hypothetical protein U1Q18_025575 [Sarracenia purpurea var. burkii]